MVFSSKENVMKRWVVPFVVAMFAIGTGQIAAAQGQGQGQGQGKGGDKGGQNHGQVVSDCNHRANERNLKGQERKDFTEWCESRGARYQYDYRRYDGEKSCYQKANNKGLTGDKRSNFLDKCFAERGDDDYGGKAPAKKKD
jgi:hypothetical protein